MGVSVPVVQIGIVRMTMHQRSVLVPMHVRLARRIGRRVHVLVVGIVMMPVLVLHGLMGVFMLMAFLQVHPEANAHQAAGKHEPHR